MLLRSALYSFQLILKKSLAHSVKVHTFTFSYSHEGFE